MLPTPQALEHAYQQLRRAMKDLIDRNQHDHPDKARLAALMNALHAAQQKGKVHRG